MESDDTQQRPSEPRGEAQSLASDPDLASPQPGPQPGWEADEPRLQSRIDDADLEVRHRKAMVMASLFDEEPEPVKIGRFTILRKLGEGGMGVVYLVYDTQLDRRLAVKLLREAEVSGPSRARFEREAQAMARLSHPNVVHVYEVGDHEGQLFVAMEFVEGQDLRGWMQQRRRSWKEVLEQFQQAGAGLVAAHAAGIVHRDFKPDNVLVGKDGRARVADFGLAHGLGEEREAPEAPSEPVEDSKGKPLVLALTQTGAIMGTPAYMAPEQYAGRRGDASGDQFSFCVALWEALYGERPFKGRNFGELAFSLSKGQLSEPEDLRGVPVWVRAIVTRGLAADPAARWPSMRALLDALADDPVARRRRLAARVSVGLGALALLGVSALGIGELEYSGRQGYWNALTEQLLEVERGRGLAQAQDDARRARDATRMGVARSYGPQLGQIEREDPMVTALLLREAEPETRAGSEWQSLANRVLGAPLTERVLSGHHSAIGPLRFSHDGAWLYSGADNGEVRRWEVESGRSELLFSHDTLVTELVLSPDDELLASSSEDGSVRLWTRASGDSRVVHRYDAPATAVVFAREGRWLGSASKDGSARVDDLVSGERMQLERGGPMIHALDLRPDASWALTALRDGGVHRWALEPGGPRLVDDLQAHTESVYFARALSATRALTAADDGSARLWTFGAGEPSSIELTRHAQAISALAVHGERVATAAMDGSVRISSLQAPFDSWALPGHAAEVWSLSFSPAGELLASTSFDNSAQLSRSDGRGAPQVFIGHKESLYRAAISPDGARLATGSYDHDLRLWRVDRPRLETPLRGHTDAVFSVESDPSGEWAITASHDGSARIWELRTGSLHALLDVHDPDDPRRDDLQHAVISEAGERAALGTVRGAVYLWDRGGSPRLLPSASRSLIWRLALSPEAERLAAVSNDGKAQIWTLAQPEALPLVLSGHEDRAFDLAFVDGGARLLTVSFDAALNTWDARTGALLSRQEAHEGKIFCLRVSPDRRGWATGSQDTTVRLWTGDPSEAPRVLRGHTSEIVALAYNPAGTLLASADGEGHVRVWELASGESIAQFSEHPGRVWDVEFLDGRLATASVDGALRLWSLGTDAPPLLLPGHSSMIQSLARGLDGRRLVSASADASATLWSIDALSSDPAVLGERLWRASSECLSPAQRERELAESPAEARRAHAQCERRLRGQD